MIIKNISEERLKGYRDILSQLEALPDFPGKSEITILLKKSIRTEEMAIYRRHYFNSGCFFGLFLIQSQVIENQLKNLIISCESYLEKSSNSFALYKYKKPLDEMTLGEVIDKPLSYYVKYEKLSERLRQFNRFRKSVIHHLTDSYEVELSTLEAEIASSYIANVYTKIESMISEANARISYRFAAISEQNRELVEHIHEAMRKLVNLSEESIVFCFDDEESRTSKEA